jgi:inorganic pyrophosphatase
MIGQNVNVYIDRPNGSTHPKYNDIVYSINYGYIKEIIAIDDEYQDVYVLGENEPIEFCKGVVCAVVERENDIEDKLVVVTNNKDYTIEEIKELVNFQEKFFKHKIIK